MFSRWVAALLLVPMCFSGLAMMCGDPNAAEGDVGGDLPPLECDGKICPSMLRMAGPGFNCILSSASHRTGIVVFDPGVATPAVSVPFAFSLPFLNEGIAMLHSFYRSPSLPVLIPPPKA